MEFMVLNIDREVNRDVHVCRMYICLRVSWLCLLRRCKSINSPVAVRTPRAQLLKVSLSTKRNQGCLEKWWTPGMGQ